MSHIPHPEAPPPGAVGQLTPKRPEPPKAPGAPQKVALAVGGAVAVVGLVLLVRYGAHKQEADCEAAVQTGTVAAAAGDGPAADKALARARARCSSVDAARVTALEQTVAAGAEVAKAKRSGPALLAAGYKPEQLDRAAMARVCKERGFMLAEMVASNVTGGPHYWDCDRVALAQDFPQTPAACKAQGLEHTTALDENGASVGACKRPIDPLEVACGVARSFKPQYVVRGRQRLDFGKTPRLKLLVSVPVGLSREQLDSNLRHALLTGYAESGVPMGAVTVSAWKSENLTGMYSAGTAVLAPGGEWKDASPTVPLDRWTVRATIEPTYFESKPSR